MAAGHHRSTSSRRAWIKNSASAAASDGRDRDAAGAAAVSSPVAMLANHVSLPLSTTPSPSPPASPPIGIGMLVSGTASVNVVPGIVVAVAVPGIVAPGIAVVVGVPVPGIIAAGVGVAVVDFWLPLRIT
uniref:Uncharacterized protein n=1 Tax=Oryza meridionalis TaxID=40149 RepID=A0A0E0EVU4_9ORYZ